MTDSHIIPIFDGHNDSLLNLHLLEPAGERSFFRRHEKYHVDLPRARQAGLAAGIFAIFTPNDPSRWGQPPLPSEIAFTHTGWKVPLADPINHEFARDFTKGVIDRLFKLESQADGKLKVVRSLEEIERCFAEDTLTAVMHIEGAEAIDADLTLLTDFYEAGLRSLGVVWSRPNAFGQGVPFEYPSLPDIGPGITGAGRELVRGCNELGIVVDLAHMNEKGFWDVAKVTDKPLVVSHTAAHALTPTSRNLTDRQLDAVAESGGVIGITFCVTDIRPDGKNEKDTSLTEIVSHITYIADRIGEDHIAFGSDLDGATIPNELEGVLGFPKLVALLRQQGLDDSSLNKIAYQNWMRVLRDTWKSGK